MKRIAATLCVSFLWVTLARAQNQRPAMAVEDGGLQERGSARVLYWDTRADTAFGQFAFNYGRPIWKKAYEDPANFGKLTSKIWRLGSNYWTVLDTQLPLRIAGRDVAPGSYNLGLQPSADGKSWSLAFIDPAKVRSARLDAFQIERAPILFAIPMTTEEPASHAEKLLMTLTYTKEKPKNVKLTISWGTLQVSAPIEVTVGN
jgi:hypothetical protein